MFRKSRRLILAIAVTLALAPLVYFLNGVRVRSGADGAIQEARRLLLRNEPKTARGALSSLLRYEPDHPEALLISGQCFRREGDLTAAAAMFDRVDSTATQHVVASWAHAEVLLLAGRLDDAEVTLRRHLKRYPQSQQAHDELRWLLFNQFRTRELERFLEAGLVEEPGSQMLLFHLLMTEMRQPVPREGISYLLKIDESQPGQRTVDRAIGFCQWQLGELEDARERIDKAWAADRSDWETRLLAAEFLIEQDQLDMAETCLERHSADDVVDDRRSWLLGRIAERRRRMADALEHVAEAVGTRPFELKYAHRYAQLLRQTGRVEESDVWTRKAAAIESANKRLTEIVLSGAIDAPTLELSREIAKLNEQRFRTEQARGWHLVAERLQFEASK
ncbi:MAG: tetratricopeptide repeat protein [Planctomycetota bacterium]|nr:tetratricopeptide repeat protein [Planctomycetota bacterium]